MATSDVTAIRDRMARIRSRARGKAVRLTEETKHFFDWKHYVRMFPWGVVIAAVVAGYVLVPSRRKTEKILVPVPQSPPPEPKPTEKARKEERRKTSIMSALLATAMSAGAKLAMKYASHYVQQMLANANSGNSQGPRPTGTDHGFARTQR